MAAAAADVVVAIEAVGGIGGKGGDAVSIRITSYSGGSSKIA